MPWAVQAVAVAVAVAPVGTRAVAVGVAPVGTLAAARVVAVAVVAFARKVT